MVAVILMDGRTMLTMIDFDDACGGDNDDADELHDYVESIGGDGNGQHRVMIMMMRVMMTIPTKVLWMMTMVLWMMTMVLLMLMTMMVI